MKKIVYGLLLTAFLSANVSAGITETAGNVFDGVKSGVTATGSHLYNNKLVYLSVGTGVVVMSAAVSQ